MSRVADTLAPAVTPLDRRLVHVVCPACAELEPVPLVALCGHDVSDEPRDDTSPVSCDQCARIVAAVGAGAVIACPGCDAWWASR